VINPQVTDWSSFRVKVKTDRRRATHNCVVRIDFIKRKLVMIIGSRPGTYCGIFYDSGSEYVFVMHELEHIKMKFEGLDPGCMIPIIAYPQELRGIGRYILATEKLAWRRLVDNLPHGYPLVREFAQEMLNDYFERFLVGGLPNYV